MPKLKLKSLSLVLLFFGFLASLSISFNIAFLAGSGIGTKDLFNSAFTFSLIESICFSVSCLTGAETLSFTDAFLVSVTLVLANSSYFFMDLKSPINKKNRIETVR